MIRKAICAAALFFAANATGQTWPAKPIRIISPASAGQGTDVFQRLVATRMTQLLGQPMVVENYPTAGGLVAAQLTARAAPDGYTLGVASVGTVALNQHLFKTLGYNPDRDFVMIGWLYESGAWVIAVHPDVPARNMSEFIAYAKARPAGLTIGAAVGLPTQVVQYLNHAAEIDTVVVSYKAVGNVIQDLISGRIQVGVSSIPPFVAHQKAGKLRFIGMTSEARFPTYPDVQAIAETLPGYSAFGWGMLCGPAGLPTAIIQRLNRELNRIVTEPAYTSQILDAGFTVNGAGTAESLSAFIQSEKEKWMKIAKAVNMKPEN